MSRKFVMLQTACDNVESPANSNALAVFIVHVQVLEFYYLKDSIISDHEL